LKVERRFFLPKLQVYPLKLSTKLLIDTENFKYHNFHFIIFFNNNHFVHSKRNPLRLESYARILFFPLEGYFPFKLTRNTIWSEFWWTLWNSEELLNAETTFKIIRCVWKFKRTWTSFVRNWVRSIVFIYALDRNCVSTCHLRWENKPCPRVSLEKKIENDFGFEFWQKNTCASVLRVWKNPVFEYW
jgi:hypothetical protein